MDFFGYQEQARRNTRTLVVLFVLAVLGIIAALYAVAVIAFTVAAEAGEAGGLGRGWWQPDVLLAVSAGTLLIVGFGTLYKVSQLRAGGQVIAQQLGGRLLQSGTREHAERQLLNVVEEVAIASGTPVPSVYLLDEEAGINAFAAGFAPGDAVVGVTRGCLEQLDRDELQGVIAHEFSHILNGDMRLNIRLVGVLHGIVCIAMAGYIILRSGAGLRSRNSKGGGAAIVGFAAALVVVGGIGMFFARLIQAAVSRQREFLADASAVQFTRNPDGIAGALKKIGGFGAKIANPQAAAMSHMFFGRALGPAMFNALATHPPLEQRIKRIDRTWREVESAAATGSSTGSASALGFAGAPGTAARGATPAQLIEQTGAPTDRHLQRTRGLLAALPLAVTAALHEPFGARALIFALVLDRDPAGRRAQLRGLQEQTDPNTAHETVSLFDVLIDVDPAVRLPLVDLALPALREMSPPQYRTFAGALRALITADEKIDLFEFVLQKVLIRHLAHTYERPRRRRERTLPSLQPVAADCQVLLSALARAGNENEDEARAAYRSGVEALPSYARPGNFLDARACGVAAVDHALDHLGAAVPDDKRQLLRACAETVAHDGEVQLGEAELLRAVADTLDCPMPMLAG